MTTENINNESNYKRNQFKYLWKIKMQPIEVMEPMMSKTQTASKDLKTLRATVTVVLLWFVLTTTSQCFLFARSRSMQQCCKQALNSTLTTLAKTGIVPLTKQNQPECFIVYFNPEKTPERFYDVKENYTFMRGAEVKEVRLIFQLKVPPSLKFAEQLVAFSDAIEDIVRELSKDPIWTVKRVRVIYNNDARTIVFRECFNAQ